MQGELPMKDFQKELGNELLASVSRSFFLSLRFLPARMREATSLAYLLARISDTIADTEALPTNERLKTLGEMADAIEGGAEFPDFSNVSFGDGLTDGEKALLLKANQCIEWLNVQSEDIAKTIRKVMRSIIKGQSNDLKKFSSNHPESLRSDEELDAYLYDVAGSVGVFWTEVGFTSYGNKFSTVDSEVLAQLGADYGKSLQLINILRDFPQDIILGRCYFPGDFKDYSGQQIWEEVSEIWMSRCRSLMLSAPKYVESLKSSKVRFSTGLPAVIGAETLNLIQCSDWSEIEKRIKVNRKKIKAMLFQTAMRSFTKRGISNLISGALES